VLKCVALLAYLHAYATAAEAKAGIGAWLDFYNTERQHQSLGYRTPQQIYQESLWVCGRSALPTGSASPASRASSEGGEMLTFAHIPTGTTVNKAMHIDDSKTRGVAPATAPTLIGDHTETGGATPKKRLRLSHKRGPPQVSHPDRRAFLIPSVAHQPHSVSPCIARRTLFRLVSG
jgi:Integrase core domain